MLNNFFSCCILLQVFYMSDGGFLFPFTMHLEEHTNTLLHHLAMVSRFGLQTLEFIWGHSCHNHLGLWLFLELSVSRKPIIVVICGVTDVHCYSYMSI